MNTNSLTAKSLVKSDFERRCSNFKEPTTKPEDGKNKLAEMEEDA